ncbi:MAG: hypothetical protein AB8B93_11140 [Pseudomonadales bacterium]
MSANLAYIYDLEDELEADVVVTAEQLQITEAPSANLEFYDALDDDECCNLYMVPC